MNISPYVSSQNMSQNGHVKSMTVRFPNDDLRFHYRLNQYGVTSVKTRPVAKMSKQTKLKGDLDLSLFRKAADRLVYQLTGKTTWLRMAKVKEVVDDVVQDFAVIQP